jgi:hypothetical protein
MCFPYPFAPFTLLTPASAATDRDRFYLSALLLIPPFLLLRLPHLLFAAIFAFEPFVSIELGDIGKNAFRNNFASVNRKRNTWLFRSRCCRIRFR